MSDQDKPPSPSTVASRGIRPRLGELAQSCRKLAMNHLAERLSAVFVQADDALFECADKAENNRVQTLFLDNLRDIRKQRPHMERRYHQSVAHGFADFLEGKPAQLAPLELDAERLTLVQKEEYEETLLVAGMAGRVGSRCAHALYALDKRLATLNEREVNGERHNPLGPLALAQAFRDTLAAEPFPLRIKTILYMLFDQQVMHSLDGLYDALNARLVEAGVLPELKYGAARPAPERAVARERRADSAPTASPAQPSSLSADVIDPDTLLVSLAALLDECRRQAGDIPLSADTRGIASLGPRSASGTYSNRELLDVLNRLQRESAEDLALRLQRPQRVAGFKAELQRRLEDQSARPDPRKLREREADVIDLIGMLFDFILDDDGIPDAYKTLLSHLHTPYLRIALQDEALFTQPSHPARALLNAMARAAILYGEEEESGLLATLRDLVGRVIHEYDGDLGLFVRLLADFDTQVAWLEHRVALRERRAVEAVKGRDRLLDARHAASSRIAATLERHPPAPPIRDFLERTWVDVLAFVQLRHGADGTEWRHTVAVAERLAEYTAGHAVEQAAYQALLTDLRAGLELLGGYHDDEIRRLLRNLLDVQASAPAAPPPPTAEADGPLPLAAMDAEPVGDEPNPPEEALSARAQAFVDELRQAEFGTWFEFADSQPPRQLKLSWFSPTTRNYMFVDRRGQRVAVKAVDQLARDMESGRVRRLPGERRAPLMDRALEAIYRALKRITGRARQPD